jgi:hypothetical protein
LAAVHWRAVSKDNGSLFANWVILLSGLLLCVSLFLTWSQLSPAYVALADKLQALQGVPHDPSAWEVYSSADVVLAVLAFALLAVALKGGRRARIATLVACVLALAFAIHAVSVPPTNGAPNAFRPGPGVASYVPPSPAPGAGETMAIIALVGAIGALSVSLTME